MLIQIWKIGEKCRKTNEFNQKKKRRKKSQVGQQNRIQWT